MHFWIRCALVVGLLAAGATGQVIRLDCGSMQPYVDFRGFSWQPDRPYDPFATPSVGYVGGSSDRGSGIQLMGGTRDSRLAITARTGMSSYRFDLPAGDYAVNLTFAETVHHGPGLRSFSVIIEGTPAFADWDIIASGYTRDYATVRRYLATVSDGTLDIDFSATIGDPIVAAVEIVRVTADTMPPPLPPPPAAFGGYAGTNVIDWGDVGSPDFAGYVVETASAATGPWTPAAGGSVVFDSRYLDASAPPATTWYRVRSVDLWGNQSPPTMSVSARTRADAESALPILELSLDPLDQLTLDSDPFAEVYVPAMAVLMGEPQPLPIEVRYRGNVSRKFPKKSWKLKLPTEELHAGRRKLNLKSEFIEYSMIRDEVSYGVFRRRGLPTPDARQVQLRLEGDYQGLFVDLEQIDEHFLARHRLDTGGDVYKAQMGSFQTFPVAAQYETAWDKKTNTSEGHDEIIALCETVASATTPDFPAEIAARLDVQAFLDYWAIQVFLANSDFVTHNFYLYRSKQSDHFMILPWDLDHSFGNVGPFATTITTDTPIDAGSFASPLGPGGGPGGPSNHLYDRLMSVDLFRHAYVRKLEALMAAELSPAVLDSALDDAIARILPDALADTRKSGWEAAQPLLDSVQLCHDFVPQRAAYLTSQVPGYAPSYNQTLFINEVLTLNDGAATDEVGEAEDYVELYNGGAAVADLSGLYLTDDALQPTQWRFPPGTTLPPGEHLLVWCDDEPADGPLHATFALSGEGEHVALFAADGQTLLDCVHWDRQLADIACARLGDGGALFAQTAPTPDAANVDTPANLPPILWGHRREPLAPMAFQDAAITVVADDDAENVVAVDLHVDTGAGAQAIAMHDDGLSADGAAADGRWGATITGVADGTVVSYWLEASDGAGLTTRDPEGTGVYTYAVGVATPALVLNELMADNQTTATDAAGDHDDWLELYNPGATPVDLGGMFLTDDFGDLTRQALPAGLLVPAGGHLLLWADGETLEGADHLGFRLSAGGEEVALVAADGVTVVDSITFGPLAADESYGRATDGDPSWTIQTPPTPGSANGGGTPCTLCGDCDGNTTVADITDSLRAAQLAAGILTPTAAELICCDVNASASITITDALGIAQVAVGLPVTLACP